MRSSPKDVCVSRCSGGTSIYYFLVDASFFRRVGVAVTTPIYAGHRPPFGGHREKTATCSKLANSEVGEEQADSAEGLCLVTETRWIGQQKIQGAECFYLMELKLRATPVGLNTPAPTAHGARATRT